MTRDQTKWNFDILSDLLEGPLLNPKRQEEAFKVLKWGRKLLTFFHPFAHRFSDLPKTKVSGLLPCDGGCALNITSLIIDGSVSRAPY